MARYLDVHPDNPQPRLIGAAVEILRADGVIAFPTDTTYALGWALGSSAAASRVRELRRLDAQHPFTLVCRSLSQASEFARMSTVAFRAVRACTPGPFTFVLPATAALPRRLRDPRRSTVGIRVPGTPVVEALLDAWGEPLATSTLLLPGDEVPMTEGWEIKDRLDDLLDAVVDTGPGGIEATTLVDLTGAGAEVLRVGAGDPSRFR